MPDGQETISKTLVFFVNGKKIEDERIDPEWTLLFYLRKKLRLCGTKLGCGEGGCGACTVMVSRYSVRTGKLFHYSVNACLALVASMHGLAVTTVEGIGSTRTGLHAVQERIARAHGSQCGFCTPGMVMSMYTLLRNDPVPAMTQIDEYMTGNLCRCTGYRPIVDAFRSFTSDGRQAPPGCGRKDCCQLNGKTANGTLNGTDEVLPLYEESDISAALHDEADFKPYDPSQEIIFPPELKVCKEWQLQELEFSGPRVKFYRPLTLSRLLQLKSLHPEAKIIVGNTEVGVEVRFKHKLYPVLINPSQISQLTSVTISDSGLTLGASVTLSSLEDALKNQIKSQPEHRTRVFSALLEMLRWFAGKQIRNAAAIGGNIMTGSPISDLVPLLMSSGATLTLASLERGERQIPLDQNFFVGYRRNTALPDEILLNVHIPYTHKDEYILGYKQARRRDDDIAIVNAGIRVIFENGSNTVQRLDLAFGGMAPTTIMATTTMKSLVGMKWDDSLLETGSNLLLKDLDLHPSAPGGMVEYRRALTLSFFFKFYLSVRGRLSEKLLNGIQPLTEEEQRIIELHHDEMLESMQIFQKVPHGQSQLDPIGRPIVHVSALKQATGEAIYVDDIPYCESELYAAFVFSERAHAKIISVDESEAVKIDGVERFFCARDVPGDRNVIGSCLDEEVFVSEKVTCVGQPIGIVVAKDQATAQMAAKRVRVLYEDIKPIIVTTQDAKREKSFYGKYPLRQGEPESALRTSDHIIEGEMHVGGQEHFYLETNTCLVVPKVEDGEIEVFASSQYLTGLQTFIAKVLDIPLSRINCRVKRVGGGFGGKITRNINVALPLCVAASHMQRPVRVMLNRDEDMTTTGGRNPFLCNWKAGFSKDGLLSALEVEVYANGGHSRDYTRHVTRRLMLNFDNAYRCANISITGFVCKTNLPSNTAFRAFGAPQGILFMENIISTIASFLKVDPNFVRERNMYATGDKTLCSMTLELCTIRQCWNEVLEKGRYQARRIHVDKFNRTNRHKKRGLSAVPIKYGQGYEAHFHMKGGALVHVYTDGSVLISHGGVEIGQGLHTKMIQVASRVLRIPMEKIYIAETGVDKVPNTVATAASTATDLNGMAVKDACEKIMARLEPFMALNPKGSWEDWVKTADHERVSLSATGFYKAPDVSSFDIVKKEGRPYNYHVFGAAVSEVEIDCLTGNHSVLQTDIVMDIGETLNPAIDIGQIEGAFAQGLGYVTLEELCYSPEGVMLTRGPSTYKIPSFHDIPRKLNVSLLRGSANPRAVYSSKGIGEPPLLLAASVFYAIKDAISSARADAGLDGVFRLDSPATAERIRMACPDFITRKIKSPEPGSFKPWCLKM
ncbi:xanthine dehydrogenase/oxidase-like [Macrobrachium nipponense]|uniref:xanthine dehydrogenase/oxidase-like n=1 Tax=Macrobrachium nipponense TaxID=159736 RepID=UPI0030C7D673